MPYTVPSRFTRALRVPRPPRPPCPQGLNVSYGHLHHLAVDCPLFKIAPQELDAKRDEGVIWAALDALRPSDKVLKAEVVGSGAVGCEEIGAGVGCWVGRGVWGTGRGVWGVGR